MVVVAQNMRQTGHISGKPTFSLPAELIEAGNTRTPSAPPFTLATAKGAEYGKGQPQT